LGEREEEKGDTREINNNGFKPLCSILLHFIFQGYNDRFKPWTTELN